MVSIKLRASDHLVKIDHKFDSLSKRKRGQETTTRSRGLSGWVLIATALEPLSGSDPDMITQKC